MTPLSDQQRLFMVETAQLYGAWREALSHVAHYKYGMRWVVSNGTDYLVRLSDAAGNGKSLGPRSPETEAIHAAFIEGKARSKSRYSGLQARLKEQARLNKAVRLGRMPTIVSGILRALDETRARDDFRMVGTHALYAYEALAGVQVGMALLASGDVDFLYDPRKKLSIVAGNLDGYGLLGILRKADKSFDLMASQTFRAVNDKGFMVDLIVPMQDMRRAPIQFSAGDMRAAEVPSLQWLVNAPVVETVIIGMDGMPVRARVPDPRAFAVHKAWLSQQPDRDPVKKPRDLGQSKLVLDILREYLPQYPLDVAQMRYFPKAVLAREIPVDDRGPGTS